MLIITNSWLLAEIDGDVEGGVSLCVPDEAKQSAVIGRQMLQVTINEWVAGPQSDDGFESVDMRGVLSFGLLEFDVDRRDVAVDGILGLAWCESTRGIAVPLIDNKKMRQP